MSSRRPCPDVIVRQEAAEAHGSLNGLASAGSAGVVSASRRSKLAAAVRSLIVVMINVLAENPPKVAARGDQHPIQTVSPAATDPALGMSIGLGGHQRRQHHPGSA